MNASLTQSDFAAWLDQYKKAWEERDPKLAAAIFTPGASYRETPFVAPMEGQQAIEDYWRGAVSGQSDVRFSYEILACAGMKGIAHWRATFKGVPAGDSITLDGLFCCDFASPDRVQRLEEWWHIEIVPAAA